MRRSLPYFLFFSIYGVINTYFPIALRSLGFSNAEVGILLGIIEAAGFTIPFLITPALDKSGKYGIVMLLLGLDMTLFLYPLLWKPVLITAGITLAVFAIGLKGLVPILDGFTAKVLGQNNSAYGKIRAAGSMGFVCTSLFLQITPFISSKDSIAVIIAVSVIAGLFTISLVAMPDIFNIPLLRMHEHTNIRDEKEHNAAFPRIFWFALLLMFLAFMGLAPCQRFFSLYVEEYLHLNAAAALWALSGIMEIPVMVYSGKLIKRFGTGTLLMICLLSIVVRDISYIIFPGITGAVIGQMLHAISFGLFHPVCIVICASYSMGKTAAAMMLFNAANGIANVLGSVIGGYLIQYAGYPALFIFFAVFPLVGVLLYMRQFRSLRC
ncbi:MAG: MFS transporter [Treponema sp.]